MLFSSEEHLVWATGTMTGERTTPNAVSGLLWLALILCVIDTTVHAQRINSISELQTSVSFTGNDALNTTIDQTTTILDVRVPSDLRNGAEFNARIATTTSSGAGNGTVCDQPSSDGLCGVAEVPAAITFESSPLVYKYKLTRRGEIPFMYYHRRFMDCVKTQLTFESTNGSIEVAPNETFQPSRDRYDCGKNNKGPYRDLEALVACRCVIDRGVTKRQAAFTHMSTLQMARDALPSNTGSGASADGLSDFIRREYTERPDRARTAFNVAHIDDDDYLDIPPLFDADDRQLYFLRQSFMQDDDDQEYLVYNLGRRIAPKCTVYDIDPIPEQVMHIKVTLVPEDQPDLAQTLTLSTVNEGESGLRTSGSSSSDKGFGSGAFTARLQNTQSPTGSYGPSISGGIVVCQEAPAVLQSTFINTFPIISPSGRVDVTENPWIQAYPPTAEDIAARRKTSAAGLVFTNRSISQLQQREDVRARLAEYDGVPDTVFPLELGPRTMAYYYSPLEMLAVGEQCGQLGVRNSVYQNVNPAISALVNPTTASKVSFTDMYAYDASGTVAPNEQPFPEDNPLPTCFPGFGPSVTNRVPLPHQVWAETRRFERAYAADPRGNKQAPNMIPGYNVDDPNMFLLNRALYVYPAKNDVETEVIVTIAGTFLQVSSTRPPDGAFSRDHTGCAVYSANGGNAGVIGSKVCNTAQRLQVNVTASNQNADNSTAPVASTGLDPRTFGSYTVSVTCPPESGVFVQSADGQAVTTKRTQTLAPQECEVVLFPVMPRSPDLEDIPKVQRGCRLTLFLNGVAANPTDVIGDQIDVPCGVRIDYQAPDTGTYNSDNEITTGQPPPTPDSANSSLNGNFYFLLVILLALIGFLGLAGAMLACIEYYQRDFDEIG